MRWTRWIGRFFSDLSSREEVPQWMRDNYERTFSALLMLIFAVAVFEALPWIVEWLRDLRLEGKLGWQGGVTVVGAIMAILSRANTLLSALGGMKKKAAMSTAVRGESTLVETIVAIALADKRQIRRAEPQRFRQPRHWLLRRREWAVAD